ncbi:MAG: hypothetical protein ACLU30_15990 [Odoribacter splanchnicus]
METGPSSGVTVMVSGTTVGVLPMRRGVFPGEAAGRDGVKLAFSFVGMKPQTLVWRAGVVECGNGRGYYALDQVDVFTPAISG